MEFSISDDASVIAFDVPLSSIENDKELDKRARTTLKVYDLTEKKLLLTCEHKHSDYQAPFILVGDGKSILLNGYRGDKRTVLVDIANKEVRVAFPDRFGLRTISRDGKFLASVEGATKGTLLKVYDARDPKKVLASIPLVTNLSDIQIIDEGRHIAAINAYRGDVIIYDVAAGKVRHQWKASMFQLHSMVVSADSRYIVTNEEYWRRWSTPFGKE